MCVIIHLKPKQMIDKEALENACYNNWHSYGLVTKVDGKLDIKRKLPKNGEIDPEEIHKLLVKDLDHERFLHVRHNTAGATNKANTHPFDVYYDEKTGEQIVFMHNGTLYEYKSKKWVDNRSVDDDDGPSDTKNFVDRILIPMTASDFGEGHANLHNRFFKTVLDRFWPATGSNRGLLISAKQDVLKIGDWKEFEGLSVSNTDYFEKVTRGPELARRVEREKEEQARVEEARRKEREKNRSTVFQVDSTGTTAIRQFNGVPIESQGDLFELSESLANIFGDWDSWDRDGMVALGYATKQELEQLYGDKKNCLIAMDLVFTEFAKMHKDLDEQKEKLLKAQKHIEKMSNELKGKSDKTERRAA